MPLVAKGLTYVFQILPHLDRHLSAEASATGDGALTGKVKRRRGSSNKGGKSKASSAGAVVGSRDAGEESRRKDLRRRVVRFLGRLGGRYYLAVNAKKIVPSKYLILLSAYCRSFAAKFPHYIFNVAYKATLV